MYRSGGFFITLLVFAALPLTAFAIGETPSTGGSCATGQRLTTASDAVVKNGTLKAGVCYNPKDVGISQSAEEAKATLRKMLCPPNGNNYGGAGPDGTINGLNPAFATCAAKFLTDEKASMPSLCLREGYRTVEKQNEYAREYRNGGGIACVKGAGCEHPSGIAIDVNVGSDAEYMKLWNDANNYGLIFYLRSRDKVHFVPTAARGGSRSGACLTSGYTPTGASPGFGTGEMTPGGYRSPVGQVMPLGTGQGPCPTGYVSYNNQCYALQNNQPLGAAQQPLQYTQAQPSQVGQSTPVGQPTYSSSPAPYATAGNTNTSATNGNSTLTGSERLNLVDNILNGAPAGTSVAVGTTSSFTSNSLSSTGNLGDGRPASDTILNTSTNAATNTLSYTQLTASQNTFSSADIGTAADITATSSSRSYVRTALENLRRRLVYLLDVLGLMRRGAPAQEIRQLPLPHLIEPAPGSRLEDQYGDGE